MRADGAVPAPEADDTAECLEASVLVDYVMHRLDDADLARAEAHLDECSACLLVASELARAERTSDEERLPPPDAAPLPAEARFGAYVLERVAGQGAMGTVYVARDTKLDRRVALKILRLPASSTERARGRLEREARAMARLTHPNVATLYEAGEHDGRMYLAMELVKGATLRAWLKDAPRSWQEIVRHVALAGDGLVAAHAAGLVHRDFKADNVLVDAAGRVVVTDFGLAATLDTAPAIDAEDTLPSLAVTRAGAIVGTPRYMAPEQFDGTVVDARSDQFSFAVTLYEALYGKRPFDGSTLTELRRAIAAGPPHEPPDSSGPSGKVPRRIHDALVRALSERPDDRFPSLAALTAAIAPAPRGASRAAASLVTALAALAAIVVIAAVLAWNLGVSSARTARASPSPADAAAVERGGPGPFSGRTLVLMGSFEDRSGEPALGDVVAGVIEADLACSRGLDVVRAVTESKDPAVARQRVAARAAAEHRRFVWLDGTLTKADAGARATVLARVDFDSGGAPLTFTASLTREEATAQEVGELARDLAQALGSEDVAAGPVEITTTSIEALRAFAGARSAAAVHEDEAALDLARKASHSSADMVDAELDEAEILRRGARGLEAIEVLEHALSRGAGVCARRRLLAQGEYYGFLGRYAASSTAYQQYLASWPGELDVQRRLVGELLDEHDTPLALDVARRAVEDHPGSDAAREGLLAPLFAAGKLADVVTTGLQLLSERGKLGERAFGSAIAAAAIAGQDDVARQLLDREREIDPELADEREADLDLLHGRLDHAETILRRRAEILTREHDATYARTENLALAQLALRRGDRAAALRAVRAAVPPPSERTSDAIEYETARYLVELGATREATALSSGWSEAKVLRLRVYGHALEGDRLLAAGRAADAVPRYEEALMMDDMWIVRTRLAEALLALRRWDDAERALTLAAQPFEAQRYLDSSLRFLPAIYAGLARAKEGAGRADARAAWDRVVALAPAPEHDPITAEAVRARERLAGRAQAAP
jgi:tRNA A-37 threonylcarbamoyl transferase component Bud32